MDQRARIRINLAQRELEVEGSETFVASYAERLEALLDGLEAETAPSVAPTLPLGPARADPSGGFGALVQHLPKSSTDVDRMLAAGWFAQGRSGDNAFSTGDANKLLAEQGIKIGNPSQCVKQNLLAKRVFVVQRGRYRIAQQGLEHLRQTLGPGIVGD